MTNVVHDDQIRRSVAWGYASPVIGLTSGIIIGTAINDLFGALEVWTWFAIFTMICASIVAGSYFAAKAVDASGGHSGAARGASILNLVLGLIWIYWAAAQSFTYGITAVGSFIKWPESGSADPVLQVPTAEIWLNQLIPAQAFVLLTVVGVYFFVTLRSKGRKS
ncbi:MAG: hypothetical protein RL670_886 [Actinomycetota bacterium]|jgi:hypothetical protein